MLKCQVSVTSPQEGGRWAQWLSKPYEPIWPLRLTALEYDAIRVVMRVLPQASTRPAERFPILSGRLSNLVR